MTQCPGGGAGGGRFLYVVILVGYGLEAALRTAQGAVPTISTSVTEHAWRMQGDTSARRL
ncbi:MAG: hypothetical protein ABFD66_13620 [Smithella sp.]